MDQNNMRQDDFKDEDFGYLPDNSIKNNNEKKRPFIQDVFEWLDVVVASVVAVVIIFTFLFRIVSIDGQSMEKTLYNKERVIITNMFYEPKYGDIVVISRNTQNNLNRAAYAEPIIKRVIGVAGDKIDIDFDKHIVYRNGIALKEPYIKEQTAERLQFPTGGVRVPENCIFVMGDNRNNSLDSRSTQIGENGFINVKYVLGHAVLRIFPLNKFGGLG